MRFQSIVVAALLSLVAGACASSVGAHDGNDAGPLDGGNDGGVDAGPSDGGSDAGVASDEAIIRVHYPAGTHTLTLRGSVAPLSWTASVALTSAGSDIWTYTLTGISGSFEFKPMLDDITWSRGPNYRASAGQAADIYPHFITVQGTTVKLISSFHSTVLNNDRDIYAYFPASYAENTDATYPVVYMHDGQNLWAAFPSIAFGATWNVDTAFDNADETGVCSSGDLIGWGAAPLDGGSAQTCTGDGDCGAGDTCRTFPEAIVIGVDNTAGRIYEYTPTPDQAPPDAGPPTPGGGGGDLYINMLINELKPQIESTQYLGSALRVRTDVGNTALVGSSLGGLISAYAGTTRPDIYGLIGAISPSTWWDEDVIVADVAATHAAAVRPLRVYVDSGSGDADDESDTDQLDAAYRALGYIDGVNYRHVVQPGAQHSEVYWAQRFPGAMQLLLGVR